MIELRMTENAEVFVVELSKKTREKENPFIAVLILAVELVKKDQRICAEDVNNELFPILPFRACENILERLTDLGYFIEEWDGPEDEGDSLFLGYTLTEFGVNSAVSRSFWVGEKGLYKVFVSNSSLIEDKIVYIEEFRENVKDVSEKEVPKIIKQYQDQPLLLNGQELMLTDIEPRCFKLGSVPVTFEIKANEANTRLVLKLDGRNIGEYDTIQNKKYNEAEIRTALLEKTPEHHYDKVNSAIMVHLDPSNLFFTRDIQIRRPEFLSVQFDSIILKQMKVIPMDLENASKWYWELLLGNIQTYFTSQEEYDAYAKKQLEYLSKYYKINPASRQSLLSDKRVQSRFYTKAKLETMDYLIF